MVTIGKNKATALKSLVPKVQDYIAALLGEYEREEDRKGIYLGHEGKVMGLQAGANPDSSQREIAVIFKPSFLTAYDIPTGVTASSLCKRVANDLRYKIQQRRAAEIY